MPASILDTVRIASAAPALAASRDGDTLVVGVDLPGVPREDIRIDVSGREISIDATRSPLPGQPLQGTGGRTRLRRHLVVAPQWDTTAMEAELADGRLLLRVPLAAAARPRRIPVTSGAAELEAGGADREITEVG